MNETIRLVLTIVIGIVGLISCCFSVYYSQIELNKVDSLLYGLLGAVCLVAAMCCLMY